MPSHLCSFFFFNDTATTEIYTLSLHDALPISRASIWNRSTSLPTVSLSDCRAAAEAVTSTIWVTADRKSTRLNSSHSQISYAVFCLKKKYRNNIPLPVMHSNHSPSGDAVAVTD